MSFIATLALTGSTRTPLMTIATLISPATNAGSFVFAMPTRVVLFEPCTTNRSLTPSTMSFATIDAKGSHTAITRTPKLTLSFSIILSTDAIPASQLKSSFASAT